MNAYGSFGWNSAFFLKIFSEDGEGAVAEGELAFHEW